MIAHDEQRAPPSTIPLPMAPDGGTHTQTYPVFLLQNKRVTFPDAEPDLNIMPITSIDLDPTEVCNLRCSYCFKGRLHGRKMSLETAKQAIRWLVRYSRDERKLNVSLLGGEPMLSMDLLERWVPFAHNYCAQRGKTVGFGVTTNGTVFTKKHHDFFRAWNMGLHLSIDGLPEIQDMERVFADGKGSSTKLEQNLPLIFSAWRVVHARSTVVPETVRRLSESYRYFCEKGFLKVAFALAVSDRWGERELLDVLTEQYAQVLEHHWSHMKRHDKFFSLTTFDDFVRAQIGASPARPSSICGAGRGLVHIDTDGLIWPCHRFNGKSPHEVFVLGSVWGGFNNAARNAFRNINPQSDMREPCDGCIAQGYCKAPCVAANWQENGDLYDAGKTWCEAMRVMYRAHADHVARKKQEEPDWWKKVEQWVLDYEF